MTFTAKSFGHIARTVAVLAALAGFNAHGAITGRVFQDFNGNGVYDTTTTVANSSALGSIPVAVDAGIGGVTVTAYGVGNVTCGSAASTASSTGLYSLTVSASPGACAGPLYRLEFTGLPAGYKPSARSTDSNGSGAATNAGSSTQFAADGATDVNFAINAPTEYCQNNPDCVTPTHRFGSQDAVATATLNSYPYSAGAYASSVLVTDVRNPAPTLAAPGTAVGSTFGVASSRARKEIYASAMFRRYAGFGPGANGTINDSDDAGAVYVVDRSTNAVVRTYTIPGATSNPHNTADYLTDTGFDQVGKTSLGGIALSEDEASLYVMNLENRTLYRINATAAGGAATVLTSATAIPSTLPPTSGGTTATCATADVRPFAVKILRGVGYVGIVCSAESTQSTADLFAYVYTFNLSTLALSASPVVTVALNYPRGIAEPSNPAEWRPWPTTEPDWNTNPTKAFPQAMFTSLAISTTGDIVLSLRDRAGDQFRADTPGRPGGDVLMACNDGAGGWTLENNGRCNGNGTAPQQAAVAGLGIAEQGPGGAEFFHGDSYSNSHVSMPLQGNQGSFHDEVTGGGVLIIPGFPHVVTTAFDPTPREADGPGDFTFTGGMRWLNLTTGDDDKWYELYSGGGTSTGNTMRKANGFGDIVALCDSAPIELGNRVWNDSNGNGVQDPGEPGIDGVIVKLFDAAGTTLLATAVTQNGGEYYFTSGTAADPDLTDNIGVVNGQIAANTDYIIRVENAIGGSQQIALTGLTPTTANVAGITSNDPVADVRDSDGVANGNSRDIAYNTGAAGTNNHGLDFGFIEPKFSIGNRVWLDTNNNGVYDAAEATQSGVKVRLVDGSGNPLYMTPLGAISTSASGNTALTVLTDAAGYYRFDNLPAGNYSVNIAPDNWTGLSGSYPLGTSSGSSTAASGTPLAGYASSTGIVGTTSGTGSTNNNDKGVDPGSASAYILAGVTSGQITLGLGNQPASDLDAGSPGGAGTQSPAGDANDNLAVDFGFYRLTVGDTVWRDDGAGTAANYNNGLKDAGESGINGVRVELYQGNTLVAVTTTAGSGNYIFTQGTDGNGVANGQPLLPDTNYTVRIPSAQTALTALNSSAPPGAQPAVAQVGAAGSNDDGDKGAGIANAFANATTSATFTLGASTTGVAADGNNTYGRAQNGSDNGTSHKPDIDLGFVPGFALGNRIWFDANNDGILNAGELPMDGVLVELTDNTGAKLYRDSAGSITTTSAGNTVLEATTASGGYYLFDGLPAGTFRVRVAASNWNPSTGVLRGYANSTATTNQSGVPVAGQNNVDHGVNPIGSTAVQAAAYTSSGVSSADIVLGTTTVGSGDTTETGAVIGTPPTSTAGDANDNLTIDFGFYRLTVGNLVWNDNGTGGGGVSNDGIQNGTEPGLAGVTVQLIDNGTGFVVAQALTDGTGAYSFTQLTSVPAVGTAGTPNGQPILPGNYVVRIPGGQSPLASMVSSADTGGGRGVGDSRDNGLGTSPSSGNTDSSIVALAANSGPGSVVNTNTATTDQLRMDFSFVSLFSLGNRVWYDVNNNGVFDAGEQPIAGVKVQLRLGTTPIPGQIVATDANGYYRFDGLAAGDYSVLITPDNWTGITTNPPTGTTGGAVSAVSGTRPLAGYSSSAGNSAQSGTTSINNRDYGVDPGASSGYPATGVSSVSVTLGLGNQPAGDIDAGSPTGAGGAGGLGDAQDNLTVDFGFYRLSVGDTVWRDDGNAGATPANVNNGLRDSGESGIAGVRVELYRGNTLIAVTFTDANGNYLFDQGSTGNPVDLTAANAARNGQPLEPGSDYQVRIPQATVSVNTALMNLLSSAANASSESTPLGTTSTDDSGVGTGAANAAVTSSVSFTLGAGSGAGTNSVPTAATGVTAQPNVDFGFAPTYSLGNRVWVDTNNDGVLNNAEVGLGGVTVTLLTAAGAPVVGVPVQITDGSGYYRFDGLAPGDYRVEIAPPPVAGVDYVSSTGLNASATGPYEPGTSSVATASNGSDHGTQVTPATIRSAVVTLGPTNLVTGEVDAVQPTAISGNAGNGDAFDVLSVDFGIFLPAKLGNFVWFDSNKNGAADPGEPGINGVLVILRDLNGNEVARQLTRNNPNGGTPGFYEFAYLIPGQYRVEFVTSNYVATSPGTPAQTSGSPPDTNNSQIPGGTQMGSTQLVTVVAGDNNPQLDAGFVNIPPIPTLAEWARLLLALLLVLVGTAVLRRRIL